MILSRFAFVALATLCAVLSPFHFATGEEQLHKALNEELVAMECPGALVGVAVGSETPRVFVLGVADVNTKAPMQRDFRMRIASVSKPLLGTTVLLLADDKKLTVEDPISKYVPGVPAGESITIRQLANNTSGLFNSIENKEFQAEIVAKPERQWKAAEILDFAFAKPSYDPPGKAWHYSNTNAVLMGEVIEKAAGRPWPEVIRERVLAPLQLEHTGPLNAARVPPPSPSGYRNGYENKWLGYGRTFYDVTPYSSSWAGAAGNMYSTIDDLLKAAKPLATGSLLSEDGRRELHAWVPTRYDGIEYGFGMGMRRGWIGHTGDVPGFSSVLGYSPKKDTTIVVLANLSNNKDGTSPAERLRDVVIKELGLENN